MKFIKNLFICLFLFTAKFQIFALNLQNDFQIAFNEGIENVDFY